MGPGYLKEFHFYSAHQASPYNHCYQFLWSVSEPSRETLQETLHASEDRRRAAKHKEKESSTFSNAKSRKLL